MTTTKYADRLIPANIIQDNKYEGERPTFQFSAAPYGVNASWVLLPITDPIDFKDLPTHAHDFHQFINWFAADPKNIGDMQAEAYICLGQEQEKHIINRPVVQNLVPGLAHCPGGWLRVDKPVFHLDIFFAGEWVKKDVSIPAGKTEAGTKYGKHLMDAPIGMAKMGPQLPTLNFNAAEYGIDAGWIVVPVLEPVKMHPIPHKHDFHQFLCILGSNPENLAEFDAEVEVNLGEEGEKHLITSPTVIHITPGLVHCPLHYRKVNKPVIHLDIYFAPKYVYTDVPQ